MFSANVLKWSSFASSKLDRPLYWRGGWVGILRHLICVPVMESLQSSLQESRLRHDQTAAQTEEEPEKQPRPRDWVYEQQSPTSLAGLVHIMAIRSSLVRRYFVQHASHTKTPGQSCLARRADRETGEGIWLGRTPGECISFPLGLARAKNEKKGEERKKKKT